jgi:predicted GTPase
VNIRFRDAAPRLSGPKQDENEIAGSALKSTEPYPVASSPLLKSLEKCIGDLLPLGGVDRETCRELREKLATRAFNLVVVGQFKRGKTTLINALIGADLLPVGVVPLTSIITIVGYGDAVTMEVVYHNGAREQITAARLAHYVTEKGNPNNSKGVAEVLISYPSAWLKGGVKIVDTPGIGSIYDHNTDVARRFLPKADAILFVLSAEQPVGEAERDFLKQAKEHASRIFGLLNKTDLLPDHEQ